MGSVARSTAKAAASPARAPAAQSSPAVIRRKCAACAGATCAACAGEKEQDVIRREPAGAGHSLAAIRIEHARGGVPAGIADYVASSSRGGQPLDAGVRRSFERSFGAPLEGVRVIADDGAARAADALGARAFTLGSSIWFGRGEYRPEAAAGRRLLAHEVAHAVQQRSAGPSIQRDLVVGDAHDPAEAAADRAADAVMRGEAAATYGGDGAVLRRQARPEGPSPPPCTATEGARADQRVVRCPGSDATYTVTLQRVPGTPGNDGVRATPGIDDTDIWLDIEICNNGTLVNVRPRVNLPQAAQQVIQDVLQGQTSLGGVTVEPGAEIRVLPANPGSVRGVDIDLRGQSTPGTGGWGIGGTGTVTTPIGEVGGSVDYSQTPRPGGGNPDWQITGGIVFRPGARAPQNPCRRGTPERTSLTCERSTTIAGRPRTPAVLRPPSTTIFVLFEYMTARIVGWRFEGDSTTYPAGDRQIRDKVMDLILMGGFRPSSVVGHASPEGPRARQPGGFEGNDALAQRRADAAHRAFFEGPCLACPTEGDRPIVPIGMSELYDPSVPGGPEVEGRPLAESAIDTYLLIDPLRPADPDAFRRQTFEQQRSQTYSMLRRAEIRLLRDPVLVPADPGTPDRPGPPEAVPCPPEVTAAARTSFGLP